MGEANAYLSLPYTRIFRRDEDGDVIATIQELPGCIAHGKDDAEALKNLLEMQVAWIEGALEEGLEIPTPDVQLPRPRLKLAIE